MEKINEMNIMCFESQLVEGENIFLDGYTMESVMTALIDHHNHFIDEYNNTNDEDEKEFFTNQVLHLKKIMDELEEKFGYKWRY